MKRIGITVSVSKGLWTNGINQNAIYFAKILKEIGYTVYLIHDTPKDQEDINDIKMITIEKSFKIPFNLVVQFGFAVHKKFYDEYKQKNKNLKLVAYECGNKFIMDMEAILFKENEDTVISDKVKPDQIWCIPQMEKTNLDYYKFLNNQEKATVVPFVWDPMAIDDYCNKNNIGKYSPRSTKRIGVMEANISVMKNVLLPIVIINEYEKRCKDLDFVTLYSTDKMRLRKTFISLISKTSIFKRGKVNASHRANVASALNKDIDLVLSWQWENNLNYLWLDVAWLGYPIIHNGSLCKDIGYYYDQFNVEDAVSKLKFAIENHNSDLEYIDRNREIIKRYTAENIKLKEQYKILVENVLNNKFKKYSYDWKTNLIE